MLKLWTTLIRGSVAEAEEAAFDRHAIRVLAQQLRDAAAALDVGKKELACAMARRAAEARTLAALQERIAGLEKGAVDAVQAGRNDLAEEAASAIAAAEDELKERRATVAKFDVEIARLRRLNEEGNRRLTDLGRGLELARAQEALSRAGSLGRQAVGSGASALREAEETLARIRASHKRDEDTEAALDELDRTARATSVDSRLAAAGFGPDVKTRPADVLARIRAKAGAAATSADAAPAAPAATTTPKPASDGQP